MPGVGFGVGVGVGVLVGVTVGNGVLEGVGSGVELEDTPGVTGGVPVGEDEGVNGTVGCGLPPPPSEGLGVPDGADAVGVGLPPPGAHPQSPSTHPQQVHSASAVAFSSPTYESVQFPAHPQLPHCN